MHRLLELPNALELILRPESALEKDLIAIPTFQFGMLWGEPRFGHPEGKVALHVREVLDNIDRIPALPAHQRAQLRLIAFAHDTFKYAEDRSRPRDWSRHHGMLARKFMETYTNDRVVLDVIETHDDAFYAWRRERHLASDTLENTGKALGPLLERMDYCIQTYYLFFKCDTRTGDKTQAPVKWFEERVKGINLTDI